MDGFEIWFASENMDVIWDALVAAGLTPVGSDALELYRIVRGYRASELIFGNAICRRKLDSSKR